MSNRKKIVIFFVALFVILVLIGGMILIGRKNGRDKKDFNLQEKSVDSDFLKNIDLFATENITGVIVTTNIDFIEVLREDGEKMNLGIPSSGASFFKQIEQDNGEVLLEEIGLLNIPQNQKVDIQYDSQTREVRLIMVK